MKAFFTGTVSVILFILMLLFPTEVFSGAQDGLLLWFQIVFPTLFPFMLISDLMLSTGGLALIAETAGKFFRRIFAVSKNGAFAVIAGFLCGYPMGARVTADLVRNRSISTEEGQYLLSFCNNASPAFIMNFIVWKTFERKDLTAVTLIILTGVPIFLSFLFRPYYLHGQKKFSPICIHENRKAADYDFSMLDNSIIKSFESIVKVGGYIIFFSMLFDVLSSFVSGNSFVRYFLPLLEMTNGITILGSTGINIEKLYPLILGLTSFGGICAAAQTRCMIQNTGLKILPYITQKLAAAAAASLAGYFYMYML